jgi:hypothetical protein
MLEDGSGQHAFIQKFYGHPAIKYLAENKTFDKPSYLATETFSQTLIHLLRGDSYSNSKSQMEAIGLKLEKELALASDKKKSEIAKETLRQLHLLYIDAQGDIDRFKINIGKWYDETMQRVTGWYKRQTQWLLLAIGFVIAVIGNVDTIKLYHILANNKSAREQMVQLAIKSQDKYAAAIGSIQKDSITQKDSLYINKIISTGDSVLDKTYGLLREDMQKAGNVLGMGWHNSDKYKQYDSTVKKIDNISLSIAGINKQLEQKKGDATLLKEKAVLLHKTDSMNTLKTVLNEQIYDCFDSSSIPGWLLTALALSLGAPFWFDLLNKLIRIRATGKKPEAATDANTDTLTTDPKKAELATIPVLRKG